MAQPNGTSASSKPTPPKPSNPPNQTLYLNNLPDKMQKTALRRQLYLLFSTHASVIDIIALRTMKMRGQAFVVFRDVTTATQVMRVVDGRQFFGRELKITYARGKSRIISRLDGSSANNLAQTQQLQNVPSSFIPPPSTKNADAPRSIFSGPPPSLHPLPQPPPKPAPGTAPVNGVDERVRGKSPGVKRSRQDEVEGVKHEDKKVKADEDESGGEAPMEEDDEGEEMDVSDED